MESKKISFGFSKTSKKSTLLPTKENAKPVAKVELIKCLEGQEIKLVEKKPEERPLTIPLKDSQKTTTALASLMKRRAVLLGEDEPEEKDISSVPLSIPANIDEAEDIEKRAARELLAQVQKNSSSDLGINLVLPVVKPDDLPLEGAIESTLGDYEHIPVQDFGKAMLRGMGWIDPLPKTIKKGSLPIDDTPMVRPKGMGLGADKTLNKKTLLVAPEANEVLEIKRNAFVRILGGKYKDLYGQIEGFDDYAGKIIVKLAIGSTKEAFNEFLCQAVSRKEYAQYAKCINSSKYDEYKKKEDERGQIKLDKDDEDLIRKNEKQYSVEDKYKVEKYIKKEKGSKTKSQEHSNLVNYEYELTPYKEEVNSRNTNRGRVDDGRYHGGKYEDRSPRRNNHRVDEKYTRREYRKDIEENCRKSRSEMFSKREGNNQTKYDRSQCKTIAGSSDSESDFYSSKHKKSKTSHSKKSKKSKSKYKDSSSDTETTSCSTESSSDNKQERSKKYRKKTKKSKKQRERSRSRRRK